jgi:hypothetical protein
MADAAFDDLDRGLDAGFPLAGLGDRATEQY